MRHGSVDSTGLAFSRFRRSRRSTVDCWSPEHTDGRSPFADKLAMEIEISSADATGPPGTPKIKVSNSHTLRSTAAKSEQPVFSGGARKTVAESAGELTACRDSNWYTAAVMDALSRSPRLLQHVPPDCPTTHAPLALRSRFLPNACCTVMHLSRQIIHGLATTSTFGKQVP